ncbi:MAG: hypothetical protein J6Y23_00020 [Prevotella sp.]|nr:hypothetical protein [Prevotella sp.]
MSKREKYTYQDEPNMQTYVCMVCPLSIQEKEALKTRIKLAIGQTAE